MCVYNTHLEEEKDKVDAEGKHQCCILKVVEVPCQEADSTLVVAAQVHLPDANAKVDMHSVLTK